MENNVIYSIINQQTKEKIVTQQVSNLDERDQQNLIELMISDASVFTRAKPIMKPTYFDKKFHQTIQYLLDFTTDYNTLPTFEQLNVASRIVYNKINGISENTNLQKSVLDAIEAFSKKRALEIAVNECYERIQKGDTVGIDSIIKDAQMISLKKDFGINFWENPEQWLNYIENEMGIIPTGWQSFDTLMNGGLGWAQLNYVVAPANSGKCECKGTEILMFNGSINKIEDIVVGDKLMGPDSCERTVLSTTKGVEKLYKIKFSGGNEMNVTGEHTLSLKVCKNGKNGNIIHPITNEKIKVGNTLNITVNDYIKTSKTFKRYTKLWRTPIEFESTPTYQNIDPYFLGLWLGDGSSSAVEITSMDDEIQEYLKQYGIKTNVNVIEYNKSDCRANTYKFFGRYILGGSDDKRCNGMYETNHLLKGLHSLNVINNKHIPYQYLINTSIVRKQLLAGIIDTDGHYSADKHCYEITLKETQLVDDVCFLCRSLGYKVSKQSKKVKGYEHNSYIRLLIYGDLSDVPILIERKKQLNKPSKDWSAQTFTIIKNDYEEEFFGFELDGDNLYIHSDFMVTHNSLCMQNMALNWSMMGYNVLFFTLEMERELVGKRMASMSTHIPYRQIRYDIKQVSDTIIYRRKDTKPGVLQLIDLPIGCNAIDIEGFVAAYELEHNIIPQIIIVDYADIMTPCDKRIDPNNISLRDKNISLELRNIARERTRDGKPTMILTASQVTKDSMDEMEFGLSNIGGGTTKTHNADNIFSVRTNDAMRQRGEYEFKILKARNAGAKDKKFKMGYNIDTLLIADIHEVANQVADSLNTGTPTTTQNALKTLTALKTGV